MQAEDALKAAKAALSGFADRNRLTITANGLNEAAEALAGIADTQEAISASMEALQAIWKPHWRNLPTRRQIEVSLQSVASAAGPSRELRSQLARISQRVWIAGLYLSRLGSQKATPTPRKKDGDTPPDILA